MYEVIYLCILFVMLLVWWVFEFKLVKKKKMCIIIGSADRRYSIRALLPCIQGPLLPSPKSSNVRQSLPRGRMFEPGQCSRACRRISPKNKCYNLYIPTRQTTAVAPSAPRAVRFYRTRRHCRREPAFFFAVNWHLPLHLASVEFATWLWSPQVRLNRVLCASRNPVDTAYTVTPVRGVSDRHISSAAVAEVQNSEATRVIQFLAPRTCQFCRS